MKYVILRDDDLNPLTPLDKLEQLYRPWLDRGLSVNLATIPKVNTKAVWADGNPEGFLLARKGNEPSHLPLASNKALVDHLHANPGYRLVHHGFQHNYLEFDHSDREKISRELEEGARCFEEAGFKRPGSFVAPYDRLSRVAFEEVAKRFNLLSTGWFELRRLPLSWWPAYAMKKALGLSHWRVGQLQMLSHPGCLLSHHRPTEAMLPEIQRTVKRNTLTVLVTHWWEYFYKGEANLPYIKALHDTAEWLACSQDIKVINFSDLEDPTGLLAQECFGGPVFPRDEQLDSSIQPQFSKA